MKTLLALLLLTPSLTLASPLQVHSDVRVYTVSVHVKGHVQFTYSPDYIVLNQPEWNNENTFTVGIPNGFIGTTTIGDIKGKFTTESIMMLD